VDSVTVTVEMDQITQAFDRLGALAHAALSDLARDTANGLKVEMQGRLRRQTSGTGRTADAITVTRTNDGYYTVESRELGSRPAMLPIWLEHGTRHMAEKPYFYGSVQLEHGTYLRRVEHALQRAIDGLGGL
jgi:hypothetical protein